MTSGSIVICHRPLATDTLDMLRVYQDAGLKVLVNEDDDLTSIPTSFDPRIRAISKRVEPTHDQAIREADGLIVTTPRLVDVYGEMARRTWILPNLIAEWVLDVEPVPPRRSMVRVGWAAVTHVHRHDLRWLAPAAPRMLRDAAFVWTGHQPYDRPEHWAPALLGLGAETRVGAVYDAVFDPMRFYLTMARCEIGIVPLDPTEPLNWSKSACKALEYMALGKPVVVVDLPEQRAMVEHGETGFVAATPAEFADYVQLLVHDPDLRARMGKAAKDRARRFTAEAGGTGWAAMVGDVSARSAGDRGRRGPKESVASALLA